MIHKQKLKDLIAFIFYIYGVICSSLIVDRIKSLTFYYATRSGISIIIEDFQVLITKSNLVTITN